MSRHRASDEPTPPTIEQLVDQLSFILAEPFDFSRTDSETAQTKVRLITAAAIYFNVLAVSDFGGRPGSEREPGLTEQVVAAAFQSFEGTDPHAGPFDKAAVLIRGIIQGHPFNDGNKRTGFLTATYYLQLAGIPLPEEFSTPDTEELAVRISAGRLRDIDEIARLLKRLWSVGE